MTVTQISVFMENRPAVLADVTRLIGEADVDIQALSVADTTDFGVLRLIVNRPAEAQRILQNAGYPVSSTEVLAVSIGHRPGSLAKALSALGSDVTVEYCYAFIGRDPKSAYVILRADDNRRAFERLKRGGFAVLGADDIF